MEWVMEKVVINTTNNHVVICRNKNCNSHKWSISCHIMKQVLQSSATAAQCELLSLRALRKEKNICDLTIIRTAVTAYQKPKGAQNVRNTDIGSRIAESESEVAQSYPTLCDPMDWGLLGFSVHGIFQARILVWIAISFSRRSSRPRDWTWVSHIVGRCFTIWATREVPG